MIRAIINIFFVYRSWRPISRFPCPARHSKHNELNCFLFFHFWRTVFPSTTFVFTPTLSGPRVHETLWLRYAPFSFAIVFRTARKPETIETFSAFSIVVKLLFTLPSRQPTSRAVRVTTRPHHICYLFSD